MEQQQPKKISKEVIIVACVLAGALLFSLLFMSLAGVAFDYRSKIKEFKAYKNLPQNPAKIEYTLAIDGEDTVFEVSDEKKIEMVTNILFARIYKRDSKKEREVPVGTIKFYDEQGNVFDIPADIIKGANGFYYILEKTDTLNNTLYALAGIVVLPD